MSEMFRAEVALLLQQQEAKTQTDGDRLKQPAGQRIAVFLGTHLYDVDVDLGLLADISHHFRDKQPERLVSPEAGHDVIIIASPFEHFGGQLTNSGDGTRPKFMRNIVAKGRPRVLAADTVHDRNIEYLGEVADQLNLGIRQIDAVFPYDRPLWRP